MTSNKLLSRLLKMKGFRVTWFAIKENSGFGIAPKKWTRD